MKEKVNSILSNKNESLQTKIQKLKEEVISLNRTKVCVEEKQAYLFILKRFRGNLNILKDIYI